jgi:hypothetical protein
VHAADVLVWALRGIGALWVVGGVFMLRQLWLMRGIDAAVTKLERMLQEHDERSTRADDHLPDDPNRTLWLVTGAVLTLCAGCAMLIAGRTAVLLLVLLIVHQLAYFIRQRMLELAAKTPEEALDRRPTRQTVNGFFTALVMAVLAAWLDHQGRLG